jgi:hypothetical protein
MFVVKWKGKVYTVSIAWPVVLLAIAVLFLLSLPLVQWVRDLFAP